MARPVVAGIGVGVSLGVVLVLLVSGGAALMAAAGSSSSPDAASQLAVASSAPRVHSESWAITTGPTTTTPAINASKASALFVFVGFVNTIIGGGSISSVSDTSSDHFHQVASTATRQNHTETLYVAYDVKRSAALQVSVTFTGGSTTQGGSVSVVDVVGAATHDAVGLKAVAAGKTAIAFLPISTNQTNDLFLFGVAGQEKDAPFTGGPHERLLATSGAIAGPFTDGMGFGTFASSGLTGTFPLYATLNQTAVWAAIAVGVHP